MGVGLLCCAVALGCGVALLAGVLVVCGPLVGDMPGVGDNDCGGTGVAVLLRRWSRVSGSLWLGIPVSADCSGVAMIGPDVLFGAPPAAVAAGMIDLPGKDVTVGDRWPSAPVLGVAPDDTNGATAVASRSANGWTSTSGCPIPAGSAVSGSGAGTTNGNATSVPRSANCSGETVAGRRMYPTPSRLCGLSSVTRLITISTTTPQIIKIAPRRGV